MRLGDATLDEAQTQLLSLVADFLDPLRFAYRGGRVVEDTVLYVLHIIYSHLNNNKNTYNRLTLFDFFSAFNAVQQPYLLAEKLLKLKVSISGILWVHDYLTIRPQFVRPGSALSNIVLTNTGAAQGTVSSPFDDDDELMLNVLRCHLTY